MTNPNDYDPPLTPEEVDETDRFDELVDYMEAKQALIMRQQAQLTPEEVEETDRLDKLVDYMEEKQVLIMRQQAQLSIEEREFHDAHERWVVEYMYRINNWSILIIRDANPKVVITHAVFATSPVARFAAMAIDENVRAGDMVLAAFD